MFPVAVKKGAYLGAESYRVLAKKRPGMSYALVEEGSVPGELKFEATKDGFFTRNMVQEGGQFWAEIK